MPEDLERAVFPQRICGRRRRRDRVRKNSWPARLERDYGHRPARICGLVIAPIVDRYPSSRSRISMTVWHWTIGFRGEQPLLIEPALPQFAHIATNPGAGRDSQSKQTPAPLLSDWN